MYLTVGEKCKPLKYVVQLEYENVYRKGQADPDNQRTDKWNSTVFSSDLKFVFMPAPYKGKPGVFRRRSSPSSTPALASFGSWRPGILNPGSKRQ
jgi:hypothetical protein